MHERVEKLRLVQFISSGRRQVPNVKIPWRRRLDVEWQFFTIFDNLLQRKARLT